MILLHWNSGRTGMHSIFGMYSRKSNFVNGFYEIWNLIVLGRMNQFMISLQIDLFRIRPTDTIILYICAQINIGFFKIKNVDIHPERAVFSLILHFILDRFRPGTASAKRHHIIYSYLCIQTKLTSQIVPIWSIRF